MEIPWGAADLADDLRAVDEVKALHAAFERNGPCKTAARAIVEEMLRSKLHFHRVSDGRVDFDRPVPFYLTRVVSEAIKSVLQFGYFAYRVVRTRKRRSHDDDGKRIEIAPCGSTYPVRGASGEPGVKLVPGYYSEEIDATKEWSAIFFRDPVFSAMADVPVVRSCVADGMEKIDEFESLFANFMLRDTTNSRNGVYLSVNPAISNVNGGVRTWFSGRSHDADASLAPQIARSGDFQKVVQSRADTIRALGQETSLLRSAVSVENPVDHEGPDAGVAKQHVENVVTDGYTYTERRALQSQSNASHHYDRLETTIMFLLGVPPQAIGKNINSERLASSNSLTQAALRMFYGAVDRYKHVLGRLFDEVHSDGEQRLQFSRCLTQYDLGVLMPLLDTARVPGLLECAYHVPSAWFSEDRISAAQAAAPSSESKGSLAPAGGKAVAQLAAKEASGKDNSKN